MCWLQVVMEAVMVRLPWACMGGDQSLLQTLVESQIAVETFGSVRRIRIELWLGGL